ncbi:MAG: dephospho-CoA kinase [Candidatus Eisenbacteria bacterium]|nr:dephospho-CoA kinase [Candidatus Eisenbacteria bacterium]
MRTGSKHTDVGVLTVAVTGGIASGKTSVCRFFERRGAKIIDADAIGRRIVEEEGSVLSELVGVFGDGILGRDRKLDRSALARLAFCDKASLEKLNKVVHPLLIKEIRAQIAGVVRKGFKGMIVVDAALIFEWNLVVIFDAVVVVSCSESVQQARMRERDSLGADEALSRIRCQIPQAEKVAGADFRIENEAGLRELEEKAAGVWEELQELLKSKEGG